MAETTLHCMTLRVVKYNDTTSIVTAWSRERGRVSIAVQAGNSREARRRRALMMPFSLFACDAYIKENSEMLRVSEVRSWGSGNVAITDPVKNVVAMFLADFLCSVLRENQPDALLTDFMAYSVDCMVKATATSMANFHLWFIFHLGHYLGISPDTGTYARGRFFDMREGVFTTTPPLHRDYLPGSASRIIWILSRMSFDDIHKLRLSHIDRNAILDAMLDYYSMHHTPVNNIPSLQIARSVF